MTKTEPIICLIDQSEHDCREYFHIYLRKLGVKQEDYYTKYAKRYDRYSGFPIVFRTVEQYLSAEFNSKDSLKRWILANPAEGKRWAIEFLAKRKEEKNLIYAPTQVELTSLMCPTMHYYETIGGYYNICKSLGYKCNFTLVPIKTTPLGADACIICDTREQTPFIFPGRWTEVEKLNVGDYGLRKPHDLGIYIERKTLSDMVFTFSRGLGRFKKELIRAKKSKSYIVMVVEEKLVNALLFNHLPNMRYAKVSPPHIFKSIRDILHEFPNFQILFAGSSTMGAAATVKIFEMGVQVKKVDLQWALESGALKL